MAKNIFTVTVLSKGIQQKIIEIAHVVYCIITDLSKIDDIFNTFILRKDGYKNVKFKIDNNKSVIQIASTILEFSKKDIRKYEKEEKPTVEYLSSLGFSFLATFYNKYNKETINISFRMGGDIVNSINLNIHPFSDFITSYELYYKILNCFTEIKNVFYGGVLLQTNSFINEAVMYAYRLGWITYFSNESEIKIPDDLEGFEYEHTDKGKYLIATREDFTVSKEAYQEQKEKLLKTMEYLGKTVPGYLRNEEK